MFLDRPCSNCPFLRSAAGIRLTTERAEQILESQLHQGGGAPFHCHKTVRYLEELDEEGEERFDVSKASYCAGALLLQKKLGVQNQAVQIAVRLGVLDLEKLSGAEEVFDTAEEMVQAQEAFSQDGQYRDH